MRGLDFNFFFPSDVKIPSRVCCVRFSSRASPPSDLTHYFLIAGDRISSVKISFRNMVYEDALTILSYASPYDVELEVENGGSGSKPTTLLKKSVGPSPIRICHPLYRSQSIPEISKAHTSVAKRLFIADPNESVSSNYSPMNSTLKSAKSTPANGQNPERGNEETKNNHHKFGIKVLPALDGTVHRIENQNEHNTNLERRHSRKMDAEKSLKDRQSTTSGEAAGDDRKLSSERLQQRADSKIADVRSVDTPDDGGKSADGGFNIPSEVPTEVHNAAIAARRNRKSSSEPLKDAQKVNSSESEGAKSPQKNKRKAPAPPRSTNEITASPAKRDAIDTIDSIADYTESLCDYVNKTRENTDAAADARRQRLESQSMVKRRNSESDTDSEMQNSFTTIELNPADITIHRTPVPEANDDNEDEDDMYRKAASLGDLSKYESKAAATLERAQSLDMSTESGAKKRKAPLPPEDINESTEDLTKLDQIDTFDRRKLKKSNEWGTLEDVIWSEAAAEADEKARGKARTRKKSNGTLERSKSAVEIKLKEEVTVTTATAVDDISEKKKSDDDSDRETNSEITSIELYNLPLSKRLTQEFIHTERMFNPDEDNSLARIVNDGQVVKSPTPEEVELDFQLADKKRSEESKHEKETGSDAENLVPGKSDFSRALRYFELHTSTSPTSAEPTTKVNLTQLEEWKEEKTPVNDASLYVGRQPVAEEPISKTTINRGCRYCDDKCNRHSAECEHGKHVDRSTHTHRATARSLSEDKTTNERETGRTSTPTHLRIHASKSEPDRYNKSQDLGEENAERKNGGGFSTFLTHRTKFEQRGTTDQQYDRYSPSKPKSPTDSSYADMHFARRVINVSGHDEDDEEEDEYEFGVTANSRKSPCSPKEDRHNISSVSVSSGENSEDSGLVRESMDYNNSQDSESRPPLPNTPMPNATQKMTYITEIKVSPNKEGVHEISSGNDELTIESNGEPRKPMQHEIKVTSNGKPTSGKKPPVPPRRSDIAKSPKEDRTDKQVVYVSEYKSTMGKGPQILDANPSELKQSENKKFEHWIFMADKEQNRWSPASGQPQPVTNIVLSPREETN